MLNPRFFAAPSEVLSDLDSFQFKLAWYSQVENFILVHWKLELKPKSDNLIELSDFRLGLTEDQGECLYQNDTLIAWDWQELQLGNSTEEDDRIRHLSPDPRSRVNQNVGRYGVPPAIANALRSPSNQVWFQI